MTHSFKIHSPFQPAGDQPAAISALVQGLDQGLTDQVLLGVTGSGKTFTMAHIIETRQPLVVEDAQINPYFVPVEGSEHIHGWIGAQQCQNVGRDALEHRASAGFLGQRGVIF